MRGGLSIIQTDKTLGEHPNCFVHHGYPPSSLPHANLDGWRCGHLRLERPIANASRATDVDMEDSRKDPESSG